MATMSEPKAVESALAPTCMESVNRVTKLPVVESAWNAAADIYTKVKDYNSTTQWLGGTTESVVSKGVEVGRPLAASLAQNLEGPIKKVDGVLCTGLDYVETKVPAMKLPPGEMYNATKEMVGPRVESAYKLVQPVVESAKQAMEPALEQAQTLKNYGTQKLEDWWKGCGHQRIEGAEECVECKKVADKGE